MRTQSCSSRRSQGSSLPEAIPCPLSQIVFIRCNQGIGRYDVGETGSLVLLIRLSDERPDPLPHLLKRTLSTGYVGRLVQR